MRVTYVSFLAVLVLGVLASGSCVMAKSADCPAAMYDLDPGNSGVSSNVGFTGAPQVAWRTPVASMSYTSSLAMDNSGTLYAPYGYAINAATGAKSQIFNGNSDSSVALDANGRLYNLGGTVECRLPSGALVWSGTPMIGTNSPAKLGYDGTVYGYSNAGVMVAYDADGKLKWQSQGYAKPRTYPASMVPAIDQSSNVYFATDNSLVSLDAHGQERWSVAATSSSPLRIGPDGNVYAGQGTQVAVLDPATGSVLKTLPGGGSLKAISGDGTMYFAGYDHFRARDHDGNLLWDYYSRYSSAGAAVIDAEGKVYFNAPSSDGTQRCLIAISETGSELWRLEYGRNPLYADPVIGADGHIYMMDNYYVYSVVPEPTMMGLLGVGLAVLAARRRRRRSRSPAVVASMVSRQVRTRGQGNGIRRSKAD